MSTPRRSVDRSRCAGIRTLFACVVALIAAAAAPAEDLSQPGPFGAGFTQVTVQRSTGGTFTSLLFYPATARGENTPYAPDAPLAPVISFGHGFLTSPTRYQSTLEHLATRGYIVYATQSALDLFPNHLEYARDLLDCLAHAEFANADPHSILFGRVLIGAYGLSGHSMGGGASILAAAMDDRVIAVANLAAADTSPSSITAMANVLVPINLIAGTNDTITPPNGHVVPMYANGNAPKQLAMIQGGYHCGFLDSSIVFCDSGPLPRAQQLEITRRELTGFFDLYLRQDQGPWSATWGPNRDDDPRVEVTLDPGVRITPEAVEAQTRAGTLASVPIVVRATRPVPSSYTMLSEGGQWPITFEPAQTPVLSTGDEFEVTVNVMVPPDGDIDSAILSARADIDGGTRSWASLTTTATCAADLNGDGVADSLDFFLYLDWFAAGDARADLDGDGTIDSLDFFLYLDLFAVGCP